MREGGTLLSRHGGISGKTLSPHVVQVEGTCHFSCTWDDRSRVPNAGQNFNRPSIHIIHFYRILSFAVSHNCCGSQT